MYEEREKFSAEKLRADCLNEFGEDAVIGRLIKRLKSDRQIGGRESNHYVSRRLATRLRVWCKPLLPYGYGFFVIRITVLMINSNFGQAKQDLCQL